MTSLILTDAARYAHGLAVAVGLGAAFAIDLAVLRALGAPITDALVARLADAHRVILGAVIAMWVTGLVMIGIRTGFDPDAMSPKLLAKLVTVVILTLNAVVLGRVVVPLLARSVGQRALDLPVRAIWLGCVSGAVSTASWLFAFALGVSAALKTQSAGFFLTVMPGIYAVALVGAALVVLAVQLRGARVLSPHR
ncbi:MAG: hypothetical protein OIF47_07515 [Marinibacterium sp.]|nr:hypothetical protein [Marinibacterium sp.]